MFPVRNCWFEAWDNLSWHVKYSGGFEQSLCQGGPLGYSPELLSLLDEYLALRQSLLVPRRHPFQPFVSLAWLATESLEPCWQATCDFLRLRGGPATDTIVGGLLASYTRSGLRLMDLLDPEDS